MTRRYDEIAVLGDGAFGIVTKCLDKQTGEMVAIKKMKQRYTSFEECLQLKEVKSLRKIKHENVEKLLQVFRENDHLYLVFELEDGGSLLDTIKAHDGPFTEPEVRFIIYQMLEGLAFVHRQGFFHRDIKPENIMWKGEVLKIADFGLAREIRSRPPYTEYISTRWYRAPEIVLRHEFYNSPVDIWAVGAIMAELFTLKPLFQGTSETDQLFKICAVIGTPGPNNWPDGMRLANRLGVRLPQSSPTSLATLIPGASSEALDLLSQLLRLDPTRRPSASQALLHPFFRGPRIPPPSVASNAAAHASVPQSPPQNNQVLDDLPNDHVDRISDQTSGDIVNNIGRNSAGRLHQNPQPGNNQQSGYAHSRSVEPMRNNNPSASMDEDPDPDGIDDILDGLI